MTDTPQSVSDMEAQIAALQRQRDTAALVGLKAAQSILNDQSAASLAERLEAVLDDLPNGAEVGGARNQAALLIANLRRVTAYFDREAARVQKLVDLSEAAA